MVCIRSGQIPTAGQDASRIHPLQTNAPSDCSTGSFMLLQLQTDIRLSRTVMTHQEYKISVFYCTAVYFKCSRCLWCFKCMQELFVYHVGPILLIFCVCVINAVNFTHLSFCLENVNKKLIRRWDSECELSLRRHRTRDTKYNRLLHKFRHRSTRRLFVGTNVYQIQWNNAM